MTLAVKDAQKPSDTTDALSRPQPAAAPAAWPIAVLLLGYPLWWILGIASFIPLLLAVPMVVQIVRTRRQILVPRGTGWLLLFLVWVVASGFVLGADAPWAVPGGGPERMFIFLYRLAWYLTCAVAMIWICNARERVLPSLKVARLLGWMFVVTVAGGLLGMFAPKFEFTSALEAVLPSSLTENAYVRSLIHPAAANLTTFLGREEYRPIAPFDYANTWGANLSMLLPFFIITWFGNQAGWRRKVGPIILLLSAAPIVYSLNRGLWACLGVGAAAFLIWLAIRGRIRFFLVALAGTILATVLFFLSPLAALSGERLDAPHSNDRRGELLTLTVESTIEGSPIVGFGNTRDVQGSFASIAGGSRADCPSCAVPPLGTQGQLWLVIFSQGIVGAFFFLMFFLAQLRTHWRCRSPLEFSLVLLLVFFFIQMFIYDTLGLPLLTLMVATGLAWRERAKIGRPNAGQLITGEHGGIRRSLNQTLARARTYSPILLATALAGAGVGSLVASSQPPVYEAKVSLLVSPAPLHVAGADVSSSDPRQTTVDTEASILVSQKTLEVAAGALGIADPNQLAAGISVTASPNTRVVKLTYLDSDEQRAQAVVDGLVKAYQDTRGQYFAQRRASALAALENELSGFPTSLRAAQLRDEVNSVLLTPSTAAEVLRATKTDRIPEQRDVPITSSALLGFLVGIGFMLMHSHVTRRDHHSFAATQFPFNSLFHQERRHLR